MLLAILIGTIVGWFIYPQAFDFLKQPYVDGIQPLLERKGFEADWCSTAVSAARSASGSSSRWSSVW